jgi:dipeptidyl aminopeptidase/acylaminoacyl peptidase
MGNRRFVLFSSALLGVALLAMTRPVLTQGQAPPQQQQQGQATQGAGRQGRPAPPPQTGPCDPLRNNWGRDFDRDKECQAASDKIWSDAMRGVVKMQKLSYKSRKDGMDIPFFLFEPLKPKGPKGNPALVWVHPDIRGHVYEYYIPYVKEAVSRGYVVIAPEYRGSKGYGQEFWDAIDYGGAEVDDVVTAVSYLKDNVAEVDPARVGIIGWSHGGMITLLSITREPAMFKCAVANVPVTNLFQRLAWAGVERQHQAIDPANRYGGLPADQHDIYKDRSPLYQVDKIQIPLLVHVTKNDQDVHIEEDMQLVDALRSRKADLAETKVYDNPMGGHLFDRQYDPNDTKNFTPIMTRELRDSWNRVWTFLDWNLNPYQ